MNQNDDVIDDYIGWRKNAAVNRLYQLTAASIHM